MRDIKFRIWITKYGKEMRPWGPSMWDIPLGCFIDKHEDAIFMQYTGLKDKNGKEIYEGDILLEESDGAIPFVIEWEKEQWVEDGFVAGFTCLSAGANCYSVIGNIYENPELLK